MCRVPLYGMCRVPLYGSYAYANLNYCKKCTAVCFKNDTMIFGIATNFNYTNLTVLHSNKIRL